MSDLFPSLYGTPAQQKKQAVLSKVASANSAWVSSGVSHVKALPKLMKFTGEELRNLLLAKGLGAPTHHNAWGALVLALLREDLIVETGEYQAMKGTKSHARRTPVYARV